MTEPDDGQLTPAGFGLLAVCCTYVAFLLMAVYWWLTD